jgi:hypothetical protein
VSCVCLVGSFFFLRDWVDLPPAPTPTPPRRPHGRLWSHHFGGCRIAEGRARDRGRVSSRDRLGCSNTPAADVLLDRLTSRRPTRPSARAGDVHSRLSGLGDRHGNCRAVACDISGAAAAGQRYWVAGTSCGARNRQATSVVQARDLSSAALATARLQEVTGAHPQPRRTPATTGVARSRSKSRQTSRFVRSTGGMQ